MRCALRAVRALDYIVVLDKAKDAALLYNGYVVLNKVRKGSVRSAILIEL